MAINTKMFSNIIIGHMLGDGHIARVNKGNSYFTIHRKAEHHEYNLWTKRLLKDSNFLISNTYPKIRESGGVHNFPSSYLRTARDKFWSEQRFLWYKNKQKILPKEYIEKNFDNLSFLLWFLDDGDKNGRISTDSFSEKDLLFLREFIDDRYRIRFNIQHQYNRPHHRILKCPKGKRIELMTILRSLNFSIPCMSYKLNLI